MSFVVGGTKSVERRAQQALPPNDVMPSARAALRSAPRQAAIISTWAVRNAKVSTNICDGGMSCCASKFDLKHARDNHEGQCDERCECANAAGIAEKQRLC